MYRTRQQSQRPKFPACLLQVSEWHKVDPYGGVHARFQIARLHACMRSGHPRIRSVQAFMHTAHAHPCSHTCAHVHVVLEWGRADGARGEHRADGPRAPRVCAVPRRGRLCWRPSLYQGSPKSFLGPEQGTWLPALGTAGCGTVVMQARRLWHSRHADLWVLLHRRAAGLWMLCGHGQRTCRAFWTCFGPAGLSRRGCPIRYAGLGDKVGNAACQRRLPASMPNLTNSSLGQTSLPMGLPRRNKPYPQPCSAKLC